MWTRHSGRMARVRAIPNLIGVRHVGLAAKDPAALAAFYRDVLGMTVVRQTSADAPVGATLFLARQPEEHEDHDLLFLADPTSAHTAFEVASLGELLACYREIKARVPIKMARNHGVMLSFYFEDPEGHVIEINWPTNVRDRQGRSDPIDLDRPEEEVRREVERMARQFGLIAAATAS